MSWKYYLKTIYKMAKKRMRTRRRTKSRISKKKSLNMMKKFNKKKIYKRSKRSMKGGWGESIGGGGAKVKPLKQIGGWSIVN